MAITSARMQMRRGLEADFDPDKMQPGEWAVSLDKKYVRMCFSVGVCVRMATYDAFEEDMAQIEKILEECQSIEEAVVRINAEVSENAQAVVEYTEQAKKYRDEAKAFRDEAEQFAPEGYAELQETVASNTVKIDTIIEKAELNIKNSAKGKNLHLTDSANSKVVEFGLYGKAEQKQYSGKNLLNNTATTQTINGVTFTVNADGSVTVNGTASEAINFSIGKMIPIPNTAYILSSVVPYYTDLMLYVDNVDGSSEWLAPRTFTPTTNTEIRCRIYVKKGKTVNNITFYPMIRLASITDGTYEPFVGGIASPNPDYPQEITVAGESYNLLENTATSQTINGVEFVVNDDGSVTANGTATAANAILAIKVYVNGGNIVNEQDLAGKEVILSGCPSGGTDNSYRIQYYANAVYQHYDYGQGVIFTPTEILEGYVNIAIRITKGYTADNLTFYPMIRKASVKNDRYMPYGVGSVEVKSVGGQLFNVNEVQIGVAWNGASNVARAIEVIECKPNTTYTITCDSTIFDGVYYFQKVNKTDTIQNGDGGIIRNVLTITTTENTNFLVVQFNKENISKTDIENAKVMVNEGTVATEYQPYKETLSTIPTPNGLCGIKVSSGGNYTDENGQQWICDEVVKYADGSGKRVQRIGKIVLNGSETYYRSSYSDENRLCVYTEQRTLAPKIKSVLCDTFVDGDYIQEKTVNIINSNMQYINIGVSTTIASTVDEFKTWLSNNNVTVYTELETPIITDLTAEEIAEIEKLHTFYPITNISNDADCGMSVTYLCDAKNYIDNRLALIETALVNSI